MTEEWNAVYGPYRNLDEAWSAHRHAPDDDQPDLVPAPSSAPLSSRFTHAELMAHDFPPLTAAEAVRQGICDGNCLVATGPLANCTCSCHGQYHGLLADIVIEEGGERQVQIISAADIPSRKPQYFTVATRHDWHPKALHGGYQTEDGTWRTICGIGLRRPDHVDPLRENRELIPWMQTRRNGKDHRTYGIELCKRCISKTGPLRPLDEDASVSG